MPKQNGPWRTIAKVLSSLRQYRETDGDNFDNRIWQFAQKAGCDADELREAFDAAYGSPRSIGKEVLIQSFSPEEIVAKVIPDDLKLVGDMHMNLGAMTAIAGAPGVGKTHVMIHLAVCGATQKPWLGLPVHRKFRTYLLQNENGILRLKNEFARVVDLKRMREWIRITEPPPCGLAFARDDFKFALKRELEDFRPHLFAIDPFSNVAIGDKKTDYDAAFMSILECLPQGKDAPAVCLIAHTRKPRTDERTNGKSLLHLLSGSYVLGSRPRSVFVLQSASDDVEDRRVIVTCCKNNDGDLGPRTAWISSEGKWSDLTREFDWPGFDGGVIGRPSKVGEDDLKIVFKRNPEGLTRARLISALMLEGECTQSTAYDVLKRFETKLQKDDNGLWHWRKE